MRLRASRRLFKAATPGCFDPKLHMSECVRNAVILKPLLARMNRYRTAEGNPSMFKISQVEREILRFGIQKLF